MKLHHTARWFPGKQSIAKRCTQSVLHTGLVEPTKFVQTVASLLFSKAIYLLLIRVISILIEMDNYSLKAALSLEQTKIFWARFSAWRYTDGVIVRVTCYATSFRRSHRSRSSTLWSLRCGLYTEECNVIDLTKSHC